MHNHYLKKKFDLIKAKSLEYIKMIIKSLDCYKLGLSIL